MFFNGVQYSHMWETLRAYLGAIAVPVFLFAGLAIMFNVFRLLQVDLSPTLTVAVALSPIWLPVVLFYTTFDQWMWYVTEKFKYENGRVTLRIKLPQEVLKSPEAMEAVFTQVWAQNRPENLMHTYLDGRHPLVASFELVSIGGDVRFYVNVPRKKVKNNIEAQLYAQFPGIEITEELIDYTAEVVWDRKKWDLMSFHVTKKEDEVFPIKTYIDYKLDQQPKEELKFEPMTPLIEHLGKAKPHERLWIQILCTPHTVQNFARGSLYKKDTWEVKGRQKCNEIMKRDDKGYGVQEETESRPIMSMNERDTVAAIERNTGKYAYETAIRAMYITDPDKFDGDMIGPMLRGFSQYDVIGRNLLGVTWRTDFDYRWLSDISGNRKWSYKKRELEFYKARFYLPSDKKRFKDKPKVMSVEELATIYHIPGSSVVTPNLARVESTKKEAPANLPISTE